MERKSKLNQYKIDYICASGAIKSIFVNGKNERNAISNALINRIDTKDIKIIKCAKVGD